MRTADLIGRTVYDTAGLELGKVHDIRAGFDGARETDAPYAVTHLLIAASTVAMRLGYGYGHMRGPWPLSAVVRRYMRNGYAVRWDQIRSMEGRDQLVLDVPKDQLMTAHELVESEADR
jgi:sporulation protein YlmC with PRC-barrel domain